jgi:probable rRNA maturation factor
MTYQIDITNNSQSALVPSEVQLITWVKAALQSQHLNEADVSIYLVDEEESQTLNAQYRHKNAPTNVLAFPADLPEELEIPLLGDLVVCAPVVEREAIEQGKSLDAHWAHMLVHGSLHLLGFDHINDEDANIMETLETQILTGLGYPPPYANDFIQTNNHQAAD